MERIKFGTDGWRAVIAQEFTVENVIRVTNAVATWLLKKNQNPSVVIGHDCRFGGKLFTETVAKVLASKGIKVFIAEGFVSTPMVSLGILHHQASMGVVITASHNPPEYNGYKLKGPFGGPLLEEDIRDIEHFISDGGMMDLDLINQENLVKQGWIEYVDLETAYVDHLSASFNVEAIRQSNLNFAFDAMYGSGQNVFKKILPDMPSLHCELNPTFKGIPPEPLAKNLKEFSAFLKEAKNIDAGLAVDGDADRIAMLNEIGEYVDSHHIILLLIHTLVKYKNMSGLVVTGFSSTVKVETLAAHYGLDVVRVKIGFKDICKVMLKENVLVGGEESGGIAVGSHIPERDGIWMGMILFQMMVETGKTLSQLIDEVYEITGKFAFKRQDIHLTKEKRNRIAENCRKGKYSSFGDYKVERVEDLDGFKYYFNDHEWYMIRPSGTEPVLRTYAESSTPERAAAILEAGYNTIMGELN
ncbi:MAG TPA: hypothetical protein VE912_08800 [Bacteroidales bacterium]|nr:hypothetical protein [Bacteroidales bacterium]